MEKYKKIEDQTIVKLIGESPNGDFIMLQKEGSNNGHWVISADEFKKQYKKIEPE